MNPKMQEYEKARRENADKWANYKGPFTKEVIAEMHADNEKLKKLGKEATREWLREKEHG